MTKKTIWCISLVLVTVVAMMSCGSKETPEAMNADPSQETVTSETPESGDFWADIPVYKRASRVEEINITIPQAQQPRDFDRLEWRYFKTGDTVESVALFYKTAMPQNGWQRIMWMDLPEDASFGTWRKRDGDIVSFTSVARDREEHTAITIWRGEK